MKTPITDTHAANAAFFLAEVGKVVDEKIARRLELDRAALMAALERLLGHRDCPRARGLAHDTLSAARANFPNED